MDFFTDLNDILIAKNTGIFAGMLRGILNGRQQDPDIHPLSLEIPNAYLVTLDDDFFRDNPLLVFRCFYWITTSIEAVIRDFTDDGLVLEQEQYAPEENWDHIGDLDDDGIELDWEVEMATEDNTTNSISDVIQSLANDILYN